MKSAARSPAPTLIASAVLSKSDGSDIWPTTAAGIAAGDADGHAVGLADGLAAGLAAGEAIGVAEALTVNV
jgi:hypothetical protein